MAEAFTFPPARMAPPSPLAETSVNIELSADTLPDELRAPPAPPGAVTVVKLLSRTAMLAAKIAPPCGFGSRARNLADELPKDKPLPNPP